MTKLDEHISRHMPHAVIVEDDPNLSNGYRMTLESVGYSVELFRNGRKALDYFDTIVPHLILLDMHLPGVMGDKIIQILRDKPEFDTTRIFLATADARLAASFESKADLILLKPIGYSELKNFASRYKPIPASLKFVAEKNLPFTPKDPEIIKSPLVGHS